MSFFSNIFSRSKGAAEVKTSGVVGDPFLHSREEAAIKFKGQGVPAFWFNRGLEYGSQENLYEPYGKSAWVRRAIQHIAGAISGVELVFAAAGELPWKSTGKKIWTRRGPVSRNPASELELPKVRAFLRSPMRGLTYEDFVEASVGWLKLDECFWILDDRDMKPFPEVSSAPLHQVIVARPDRMRHVIENGELVGWEFRDGTGRSWALLPGQVIRLFGWNPYNDWRGLGDYEAARVATESDWLAGRFAKNLMANNGDTGPYIVAKNGIPTDPQREQILASLREKRQAQLNGNYRPVFLTGDITVEDPQIRAVDAAFNDGRLQNRHEIFTAFGVPPSLADVKASYSIGSASDYFQLILNTCIPVGKKFCASLESLVELLTGQRIEVGLDWDEHPVMQQVRSERLKEVQCLLDRGVPFNVANEYLRLNVPRFAGDDIGYMPVSMVPVGTAATTDPVDDPASNEDYSEPDETPATKLLRDAFHERALRAAKTTQKAVWEAHMRRRQKAIRLFQSKASKVFNDFRIHALKKLSVALAAQKRVDLETRSLVDLIFDTGLFAETLRGALDPVIRATLTDAAKELFSEIGQADDPWTMPPEAVRRFIAARENLIAGVSDTAHGQLKTLLDNAAKDGSTIEEITSGVKGVFNNLSRYEAKRIAMTETASAYGFSRDEAMKAAGVAWKCWISSHGPNVRASHRQAEMDYGTTPIPLDQPFLVGGERLMYPCDQRGSAENVINCQCIQVAARPPEEEEPS